jgi:hypothetical protein
MQSSLHETENCIMSNDVKKDDGLDIPEALLVKNRKPLTPEQQAEEESG